ncbi:hypothetical protein V8E54_012759 [Elaphomyces granulatus]
MEQRVLQIGLDIAHKVIAVCGDNAPNKDTFCDHFHRILKQKYDDDPALELGLPRCLFGGRRSRIRCLAHILAPIAKAVFAHLKSGTREQAGDIVQSVLNGDRQFPASCASLNICMKVCAFVLWIMASEERRKQQGKPKRKSNDSESFTLRVPVSFLPPRNGLFVSKLSAVWSLYDPPTTRPIEPQVNQEKLDRVSIHEWALLQRVRETDAVAAPQIEFGDSWGRYFTEDRANEFNYPDPARAARDLLALPSAEVDVERLFPEGRDTIGVRRMAMDVDTMRIVRLMKSHWDLIDRKKMAIAEAQLAQHQATFGDKTREELEVQRDMLKEKIDSFQKQILRLESSTGTVLEQVFNAYPAVPGPINIELAWDVISGAVVRKDSLTASGFFAYRHGQDALIAILGKMPKMISEYRIRFLDKPDMPTNPKASVPLYHRVYEPNVYWHDLDDRRLQFQGDTRPKARYIYFHYLLNMLRFAWRKKDTTILQPELGMPYWGTPGAYVRQGQLQGFINQLGHISGVETPTPTTAPEDDDNVLAEALKSQVLDSSGRKCLSSQEYEDSDEEIEDELE